MLLDEPTLGQDSRHRQIMGDTCRSIAASGKVVIAATHDLLWAKQYADRTILLAPGAIAADGPTADVFDDVQAWQQCGLVLPTWVKEA